jgi:four helix bundle protein
LTILPSAALVNDAEVAIFERASEQFPRETTRHEPCTSPGMTNHIRHFTDLKVWQRSMDLVVDLYRLTDRYPKSEMFVLTAHTRRTAISIPSNIAEGFCRASKPTYIKHLNIALGSEGELYTQMECGRRLGFARDPTLQKCFDDLSEVGKMLRGLVRSLEASHNQQEE